MLYYLCRCWLLSGYQLWCLIDWFSLIVHIIEPETHKIHESITLSLGSFQIILAPIKLQKGTTVMIFWRESNVLSLFTSWPENLMRVLWRNQVRRPHRYWDFKFIQAFHLRLQWKFPTELCSWLRSVQRQFYFRIMSSYRVPGIAQLWGAYRQAGQIFALGFRLTVRM